MTTANCTPLIVINAELVVMGAPEGVFQDGWSAQKWNQSPKWEINSMGCISRGWAASDETKEWRRRELSSSLYSSIWLLTRRTFVPLGPEKKSADASTDLCRSTFIFAVRKFVTIHLPRRCIDPRAISRHSQVFAVFVPFGWKNQCAHEELGDSSPLWGGEKYK